MTENDFEDLKNKLDFFEFHKIGEFYYRAGGFGLSKNKMSKGTFKQIGHCNDFRNKKYNEVLKELNKKN